MLNQSVTYILTVYFWSPVNTTISHFLLVFAVTWHTLQPLKLDGEVNMVSRVNVTMQLDTSPDMQFTERSQRSRSIRHSP
jgi:hypothetical protein